MQNAFTVIYHENAHTGKSLCDTRVKITLNQVSLVWCVQAEEICKLSNNFLFLDLEPWKVLGGNDLGVQTAHQISPNKPPPPHEG